MFQDSRINQRNESSQLLSRLITSFGGCKQQIPIYLSHSSLLETPLKLTDIQQYLTIGLDLANSPQAAVETSLRIDIGHCAPSCIDNRGVYPAALRCCITLVSFARTGSAITICRQLPNSAIQRQFAWECRSLVVGLLVVKSWFVRKRSFMKGTDKFANWSLFLIHWHSAAQWTARE